MLAMIIVAVEERMTAGVPPKVNVRGFRRWFPAIATVMAPAVGPTAGLMAEIVGAHVPFQRVRTNARSTASTS